MPPNARVIAECWWYWSPHHSRHERYQICSNRDRTLWVLWARAQDTNWGTWLTPKVVAHRPRRAADNERQMACAMLDVLWRAAIQREKLERFSECVTGELMLGDEIDELADALWPPSEVAP
jgi:hypothetical protein